MKNNLSLSTDRKSASEGEFIDIKWNCDACPDSLLQTIDSGYKCDTIAVADSGSIRIKNANTSRPAKGAGISKLKLWKEKLQAGWYVYRAQVKYWWLSRQKWQKALWIALLVLWLGMLLASLTGKPKASVSNDQMQTASITALAERPSYFA